MIGIMFGYGRDLGYVDPWNPVIAERQQLVTERILLGSAGRAKAETAADRARRRAAHAAQREQEELE